MDFTFDKVTTFAKGDGAIDLPTRLASDQEAEAALARRDHLIVAEEGREAEAVARQMISRGVSREQSGEILDRKARSLMATSTLAYAEAWARVKADPRNEALVLVYGAGPGASDEAVREFTRPETDPTVEEAHRMAQEAGRSFSEVYHEMTIDRALEEAHRRQYIERQRTSRR